MIEKMDESEGNVLGFKAIGTITKADYDVLIPEVQTIVDKEGSFSLLLDLTQFQWEGLEAWRSDFQFGRKFHNKLDKLAIVGKQSWTKWIATIAEFFSSKHTKCFQPTDIDLAWEWIKM